MGGSASSPRVLDDQDFRRLLAWEVQRATRYQDFLCLCLVRPEYPGPHSPDVVAAVARQLVELLRSIDVVGFVADGVGLILVHTPDSDGADIVDRVRARIEATSYSAAPGGPAVSPVFDIALASFPTDATTDAGLLAHAQTRLVEARRASGRATP